MKKSRLSVIQITTPGSEKRKRLLLDQVIPRWTSLEVSYCLVSAEDSDLKKMVEMKGGTFLPYYGWEKDMSAKWRSAIPWIANDWCGFFGDDIYPSHHWLTGMCIFLEKQPPGQYGFRLITPEGDRCIEDRMALTPAWPFADTFYQNIARRCFPLQYDAMTGEYQDSDYAYVANSVTHRKVFNYIQPFGLYNRAPDALWSYAIRDAGFKIGFNPKAICVHAGGKTDNRNI